MTISDDTLSAYIDGELEPQEIERLRALIASDASLSVRVDRLRKTTSLTQEAFAPLAVSPAPRSLQAAANVSPFWRRYSGHVGAALVASVAGLVIGMSLRGGASSLMDENLRASPVIAGALTAVVSGEGSRWGAMLVTPIYSFRTQQGGVCRVFHVHARETAMEGAACRAGADWRVVALAPARARQGAFTQAGSDEPAAVAAAVDELAAGDALSATEERALIATNWR